MERISTLDRRSFPIVAATIVLGLLLFCADSTYSQIRIMPLGDSITKGVTGSSDSTGYRRALYLSLTGAGYSVNFVGSQANGHPTDFDRAHEGHGGWRADQIRDSISGWLTKNPADIILLHIGTNDISQGQTVGSTVHEVKQILDRIDAKSTTTVVFLACIINRSDGYSARTTTYNRQLKDSADRWIMNGDRIIVVDQETALSYPADLADAVHPNDTGYGKMAQCWFTALSSYLATGVASPATSTITAAPTSIIADGTSASTITIQLKDANGNNLTKGGDAVTLATTAGTLTAVTDHSNGTYTATLTSSTTLETATITGTVNAVAIVDDATVTFIVGTPPAAPVLATPANGATGIATNPTLTWNASSGATSYRLQVSTDAGFATTVVDQSNITTTSYAVSNLATNTTYYWHVNATNSGGTSAYSTAWSFTTVQPAPGAPVLATPANGATGIATNPTLTWNASSGATSYRVQVSTSSAFTTTVVDQSNITTTTYAVSSLATNTTYYWHVNATNSGGTSAYSTAWSFTTVAPPPPPAVPVLATPSDGATGIATNPTLTWNASTGATSYRVQVSTSSAFTTTVVDQSNITTTSYAVGSLSTNTIYYWHVNATNSGGASAYSTTWTFTTLATPAGLVAAYAFDEGTGTTVADASGHGFTGTISGATWTTSGKFGSALVFNGTNAVVTIPNATLL
ncbi:MAG: invasin domain 3-containing protein, partial [Bacteroidota bacterium]